MAFDDRFTAKAHGFADADDYYYKASSIRVIDQIRIPTLIIHAQDDPFIPFTPLGSSRFAGTSSDQSAEDDLRFAIRDSGSEDRFWAENRVVEFCAMANAELPPSLS